VTHKLSSPTGRMEKGSTSDTQDVKSHGSDGDRERCYRVPQVRHVTCKSSCPIGWMEKEKGVVGSHKSDGEGSTSTSDTQAIGSHRSDGERPHRYM
jgi:hypothetical protein